MPSRKRRTLHPLSAKTAPTGKADPFLDAIAPILEAVTPEQLLRELGIEPPTTGPSGNALPARHLDAEAV